MSLRKFTTNRSVTRNGSCIVSSVVELASSDNERVIDESVAEDKLMVRQRILKREGRKAFPTIVLGRVRCLEIAVENSTSSRVV